MILMVKLIVVTKMKDGFSITNFNVKSLDMKEIATKFRSEVSFWGHNPDDCEIFQPHPTGRYSWVARHTGRGWTRVATTVKNWDKYASPSWVKKVKALKG